MNVNLIPQLERMVRQNVSSGLYTSAREAVRDALRLMDEHDRVRAAKLEHPRQDIRAGLQGASGNAWNAAQTKRDGRDRRAAKASKAKAQDAAGPSATACRSRHRRRVIAPGVPRQIRRPDYFTCCELS